MEFPAYLHLGPFALHPHWVFESLAYVFGARVYSWVRRRTNDPIASEDRWWVVAAGFVGVSLGSKLLYLLSDPSATLANLANPFFLMGGKSVVGGLVGGLIAVELVKRRLGIRSATGDLFAIPLTLGIAVGRIGCFLTGLEDHTHGLPTTLPWAVDFGDGPRHPTQLYEIAFLLLFAPVLGWLSRRRHREGDIFKIFMVGYLGFRLALEFIKPGVFFLGLNAIQWVCAGMVVYYARLTVKRFLAERQVPSGIQGVTGSEVAGG